MRMRKIQVKRIIATAVFMASVVTGICLTGCLEKNVTYSESVIDMEQAEDITASREEAVCLIDSLSFGEETLFYDESEATFYYSLTGGG